MKFFRLLVSLALLVSTGHSQDVRGEMKAAEDLGKKAPALVTRNDLKPYWSDDGTQLVYRINTAGNGCEFVAVDLKTGRKAPAFDHQVLAAALAKAASREVKSQALPLANLQPGTDFLRFRAFDRFWNYNLHQQSITADSSTGKPLPLLPPGAIKPAKNSTGSAVSITIENATDGDIELFWLSSGDSKSYGTLAPGTSRRQSTFAGHAWLAKDASGKPLAGFIADETSDLARITGEIIAPGAPPAGLSPDGRWLASIRDHNLSIRPAGGGDPISLSEDGTREDRYSGPFEWSPDSKYLVASRAKQVPTRQIHLIQSSPPDQLQPKLLTIDYPKAGDPIRQPKPVLFDISRRTRIPISDALFANPWSLSELAWAPDSSEFSFVYNQRGHQLLRIVAIRPDSGNARSLLEETSATFIDYSQKFYLRRLPATREILWASEHSGHNHLYLIDEITGHIKNAITQGDWDVREVVEVDEKQRQLLLKIVGQPDQDPYHFHYARVGFDGKNFTRLTHSDGSQRITFSPDRQWLIATSSRVDQPPVSELRRASDGSLLTVLETADDSALLETGWSRPERFTAKGRDGSTDIFGLIIRPSHFDPAKKYPVLEDIYAGPHDFFVPKTYAPWSRLQAIAELGFIIVKIDGMGTNWRGKSFHDVCWKNLSDAGFPDRIPWIKAAAAARPWMDLTRIGIFGGSAGGQNALAGLLHHGDFYRAGLADCGCHDNRMDKIWWNEAWMGWPVDDSYAENSNVTHAARLTGKLMLIVGELDHNVDPASTTQVIAALEKAGKDFEFVPIANADHGAAETPYGQYRRAEFFIRTLRP